MPRHLPLPQMVHESRRVEVVAADAGGVCVRTPLGYFLRVPAGCLKPLPPGVPLRVPERHEVQAGV
jgi:hypothetical protein